MDRDDQTDWVEIIYARFQVFDTHYSRVSLQELKNQVMIMEYSKGAVVYIILKEKKFATNEYANICKRQACGKAIGCEDLGINRNAYGQLWNL